MGNGKWEKENGNATRARRAIAAAVAFTFAILNLPFSIPGAAQAARNQGDVLRSISENVGDSVDPMHLLYVVFAIAGVVIVIALLGHHRSRAIRPKVLNHPGKLMREVSRSANLRPAEIKQLKVLADDQGVENPLVLLLCPSILGRAVKNNPAKVDKKLLNSLAKKLTANSKA